MDENPQQSTISSKRWNKATPTRKNYLTMDDSQALETLARVAEASQVVEITSITRREGESEEDFKRRRQRHYSSKNKKKRKMERAKLQANFSKFKNTLAHGAKKSPHLTFIFDLCQDLIEGEYKTLAARVREMDILRVNTVSIWQDPKWLDCRIEKPHVSRKQSIPSEYELERRYQIIVRNPKTNTWHELFEVKKSLIEGAGNGLFALRSFQKGEWVGLYIGEVRPATLSKKKKTIYAMRFKDKDKKAKIMDPGIPPPYRSSQHLPVYFGLQFCNDPNWKQYETTAKRTRSKVLKPNISVFGDLCVAATQTINVGDEILLDYNMTDDDNIFDN